MQRIQFHFISKLLLALIPMSAIILSAHAQNSTRPLGGWRYQDTNTADFKQDTHYPASRTNSGGKPVSSLIMGKINANPKDRRPKKLIVNGASMPLDVNEAGQYARPYAFGSGSNSVEIRDTNGKVISRRQFYEANAGKTPVKLRIILSWDSNNTDVDLHVITPKGEHAWYGQQTLKSGGGIDIDATDGYGPEIFATPNPAAGLYQIYVNYYGGNSDKQIITNARIIVIRDENTPKEAQQIFNVPLRRAGELMLAKAFLY
ncbi:YfaP family protein [Hydromonas duriensis]|uniref:Uncharacterized protein YfaP (DUF2135 family) n=1 Tax=Hydromonas duriensis TaxID=1527608 RepID=A0A4R6Y8R9_9BURK|nr:DUF2135 domain-containing protein [Hydromonas duriensis]TDR31816.1 uncharacterized protein YfaP (DUF2135 family) [Hydromonas duriensis]